MSSKSKKRRDAPPDPAPPREPRKPPIEIFSFLERHSRILIAALLLLGTIRIVSTYTVFSHTFDEPAHIATGMEWLDKGVYTWEPQHPPLARAAAALGPYLLGIRSQNTPRHNEYDMTAEGLAILFKGNRYDLALSLARLGVLPFFWIASLVVYWWCARYAGKAEAVIAVFLFTFLPPALAHAGLATTDMACTAFLGAAFLAAAIWMDEPTAKRAAIFGLAAGLAISSKFSTLPYFAAAAAVALIWYYRTCYRTQRPASLGESLRRRIPTLGLAAGIAFLLVWAVYRFSFGPVYFAHISLPFPELYAGIRDVLRHNAEGHPSFLLGERSNHGFWYFYLVDLAVKTPLALLILCAVGFVPSLGRHWLALAFAAGILAVALFSNINIGIRHVLPIYIAFAIVGATGTIRLLRLAATQRWAGWAAALLFVWYAGSSLLAHPDYIPYFNEFAGSHPENIVVDSDLDWCQDIKRLGARLREAGAREVNFVSFDSITWERGYLEKGFGFPHVIDEIDALNPSPGWNAVSLTMLKKLRLGMRDEMPQAKPWPERVLIPGEPVGKGMRLWYFPPGSVPAAH